MPDRKDLIRQLETARNSKVILYVTGDRKNQETQIGEDVLPIFAEHLGTIGKTERLELLIYSRGGNTLTGFALANALREFGTEVNILIPFRAHSCATLISLAANNIVAGPFAQLGPIDPSISTPHGPTIQDGGGQVQFLPLSVEDVANYFALAKKEAGIQKEELMAGVLSHLTDRISPLALGAVYRAREQIGMLATKLLELHMTDKTKIDGIVSKLTRELLSHDYVVNRKEAKSIGLPIAYANNNEADLMWKVYEEIAKELTLGEPWNWEKEASSAQPRVCSRGVIESLTLKHVFSSTYRIRRQTTTAGSPSGKPKTDALQITAEDEGSWKKV